MNRIPGNPVGIPNPKTDWNQTDETKADFLKNRPLYLTNFFKPIPAGKTPDGIKEVGVYLGYDTTIFNGFPYEMPYLLFVSHHENTLGDIDTPMVCQIKVGCSETGAIVPESVVKWRYCGQDNEWWEWTTVPEKGMDITLSNLIDLEYNPESSNAQSGIAVAQAIEGIGGGSEPKHFPYEPQLDITLEEAVQKLEVNEINGIRWADSDFTAIKVMVENAVLETAGPNTQVCVYINSRGYTSTQTTLGSPTTFINSTTKQYWSCYADLKSGLMITCDSAKTDEIWSSGISIPINMQRLNLNNILEYISIEYMNTNGMFPVGTRFRIWLR